MSSSYQGPGAGLGEPRPNGWTWNDNAGDVFSQRNSFDPSTGAPVGPDPLPPHTIALQWQAEHDRRVWQYRQNLMRSAAGYGQGALGLLQSYRPGGSSAIEAGQYNTLANIQLSRAQLTQPLDLTGDYVREENRKARSQANRQAERQMAIQGAAAIASVAGAFFTGGATLAALPGIINGLSNTYTQSQQTQSQYNQQGGTQRSYQGSPQGGFGGDYVGSQAVGPNSPGVRPSGPSGPSATGPGAAPAAGGGGGGAGGAQQATLAPDQGGSGMGGQPGGQGGPGDNSGSAGSGGSMASGAGGVGSDGNFSPVAWAARAAMTEGYDPLHHLAMSRILADELESDPVWSSLSSGIDKRLAARIAAMEAA